MSERTTPESGHRTVLLRGGEVHSPADPFATAMVVERGHVAWVGSEGAADAFADGVDETVDLEGALVTPAFTDAHVHTTATGIALMGLDLSRARNLNDALVLVREHAAARPHDRVLLGHGWDAARWPGGRPPTRAELDEATGGRPLYLTRIDVHSAVATTALLDLVPGITEKAGFHADAPLTADAHHAVRAAAHAAVTAVQRREAQQAALRHAASLGIGSVHECGGPAISDEDDFTALLALAAAEAGPRVVGYWAEQGPEGVARARELGAAGAAGDLFVDGALGSHTAWLGESYADGGAGTAGTAVHGGAGAAGAGAGTAGSAAEGRPCGASHGNAYLTAGDVAAHVTACAEAGMQAGFHAIGDAAVAAVVEGVRAAAGTVGLARVRAARHRVEHAEMLTPETVAAFAELGLTASVQPAFDALWGGDEGMYAQRLGPGRARSLNPYAALLRAGVPLAFGSDSPVTPLDPWGTVRAAAFHRTPEHRVSVRAAFTAHTRGGWRAVGRDDAGTLVPGAPADYAVWRTGELVVQAPDDRVARWSTDPRSGTPGLPDLAPGSELPVCLRTVVGGRTVFVRPNE
ncbi:amidohydrolase family protein [Streptomyces sp. p1417]|uniref:Amidohydrolase family protein n=1 Tax=Streptomyces typhae TaxID=2681492 RepID=A0A6L6X0R4_9ACTN|nr:amidohydrolase family protein [Streptomyces typhae]MVO87363.1 amidohydrolase family protein [Streptomyces typhae]